MKKPFLGVFLMNQPVPPAPTPLNMRVSPENRAKFTGFLEGVRSKAVTSQMPPPMPMQPGMMPQGQGMGMPPMPPQGMMPPMQPPMMPPRPPMPMNMGGMVDVFDPRYMNEGGFVISTDDSGKIATRPVFSEDRGRMVSQILSRDMVQDMADKAETPSLGEIISEKIIEEKILDNAQRADDSLKGVPDFTTTTVEPETATISMPVQKPKVQLPVSKPKFSNIEVPVSKPRRDEPVFRTMLKDFYSDRHGGSGAIDDISTDALKSLMPTNKELISDQVASVISDEAEDVSDPQTMVDFILGRGDAVFDTPTLGNLSRNVMARRLIEDDSPPISDSMPDRAIGLLDRLYNPGLQADEEEEGLDLLAKILNLPRFLKNLFRPQFTTESAGFEEIGGGEKFPPSTALRSSRFNDGGIVQGFKNGGVTVGSNFTNKDLKQAKELVERVNKISNPVMQNVRLDRSRPEVETIARGMIAGYDPDFGEEMGSENLAFAPMPNIDAGERAASYMLPSPTDQNQPSIESRYRPADAPAPRSQAFIDSYNHPLAKFVTPLTDAFGKASGYDMDTEQGRYDFYNRTQDTIARNKELQDQRQLDRERAERKLAEEQKLRDMIQGMLPPTAATAPTTPVADAPTADPATPDYGSVVVPSDRVPGFDVGNISPYPQFRMPTEFEPIFPTSLSANYFKDLFKNIGVQNMQQGGSVNQLDSAIDNFINAYR